MRKQFAGALAAALVVSSIAVPAAQADTFERANGGCWAISENDEFVVPEELIGQPIEWGPDKEKNFLSDDYMRWNISKHDDLIGWSNKQIATYQRNGVTPDEQRRIDRIKIFRGQLQTQRNDMNACLRAGAKDPISQLSSQFGLPTIAQLQAQFEAQIRQAEAQLRKMAAQFGIKF
ncbi:hypothetical protein [Corynebacterium tuberculostearicum]|uniref:hypothetical protein n=1 Tax=Corynebacterium tuberculostearicum TaxID=38304 RepID=UPI0015C6A821|nr:hypothetical protein [Corynebacterium tuberculostearicum]MCG7455405.1 hypothetical protein [Corynebacterium tuberculostearicum]NYI56383.1 hypothetical protein [Corynebacterium tuberculostearicum]QQU82573.1 hypothetical protein I6I74_04160 [Corynebacterium tuberculostearicum]